MLKAKRNEINEEGNEKNLVNEMNEINVTPIMRKRKNTLCILEYIKWTTKT
jgi:hypothetical protein